MTSVEMTPPIIATAPASTVSLNKIGLKPLETSKKEPTDTFRKNNALTTKKNKPKTNQNLSPLLPFGKEKQWLNNGATIIGGLSFLISSTWLWASIGTKRFTKWEGIHANIPMATIGGLVAGGALGVLSCRFINSIKVRLNGTETSTEKPEAIVSIPTKQ